MVEPSLLEQGLVMPLVLRPRAPHLSLTSWAGSNKQYIEEQLLKHGALLFRGFDLRSQEDFEQFINAVFAETMTYMEAATPRTRLSERVYTSTEFPPEQAIALHNELSYVSTFPMKIAFFCIRGAEKGGATPIGDVRRVYDRIPEAIRNRFIEKGWMLVRNFGYGFGPSWQSSFHVSDKAEAEAYFHRAGIECEWKPGDRLRTKQVRPVTARHPATGEIVWFNHAAFWHVSSLEARLRELLLEEFDEIDLPYNTYYGDGASIEPEVIAAIRDAYEAETVIFQWQEGDLLLLENMLTAHGRRPYTGSRRVLAAMGDPFSRTDL
jgi:alpha-ketoglutarate-dependent taurine dioxygenase